MDIFWFSIILFLCVAGFFLYSVFKPAFNRQDSTKAKEIATQRFKISLQDSGPFLYSESGFLMANQKPPAIYLWADIETIFAYKADWLTSDEICLDVFMNDQMFIHLTEGTPGWYQFSERLLQHFPGIPKDWEFEMMSPVFETKFTLLFDKKGRTKEEAITGSYQSGSTARQ